MHARTRGGRLPWAWTAVVAAISVSLFILLGGLAQPDLDSQLNAGRTLLVPTLFTGLGALIATRRPGNRVAWIFLVVGGAMLLDAAGYLLVHERPSSPDGWDIAALVWQNTGYWVGFLIPLFLLLFLFPTGRFLTRRWSWAGWVAGFMGAEVLVFYTFVEELGPDTGGSWKVANPIGFLSADLFGSDGVLAWPFGIGLIALMVGGFTAIALRFRRSSEVVRTQIKWVASAGVVFLLVIAARLFGVFADGLIASIVLPASIVLIPISIAISIIRYRLFEIDRIISRTVGYAIVVAALGLIYAAGAVWLPTQIMGEQPLIFVAMTTLAAATLFNPLRRRVLAGVDRRFARSRYDAPRVVDAFSRRLRGELDVDQVAGVTRRVVGETLQPSAISVWLRGRARD